MSSVIGTGSPHYGRAVICPQLRIADLRRERIARIPLVLSRPVIK